MMQPQADQGQRKQQPQLQEQRPGKSSTHVMSQADRDLHQACWVDDVPHQRQVAGCDLAKMPLRGVMAAAAAPVGNSSAGDQTKQAGPVADATGQQEDGDWNVDSVFSFLL